LKDVFLVPGLGYNLVSTGRLADNGIESHFGRNHVSLALESDGFYIGNGVRDINSRLYTFPRPLCSNVPQEALATSMADNNSETNLWHRRLAHINSKTLVNVHKHADGVPRLRPMEEICRACRLGKAHRLPFPGKFERTSAVGDLVHSDIMGKLEPSFPDMFRYIATFQDDHSRYLLIGCMTRRSMLTDAYQQVSSKYRRLGGANVSTVNFSKLHSDGAKEYMALQKELGGDDEDNSFSPPYTPELNGIAERVNRTIVESALALLIQAKLPRCLWPFAVKHVTYVKNRVPHSTTGSTPYSVFTGNKPSLKHVRVFGCTAYVLRLPEGTKFEYRALEGVYLETLEHGIYRVLITDDDGIPRLVESRHVTFDEFKFLGAPSLVSYIANEDSSDASNWSESSESCSEISSGDDVDVCLEDIDDASDSDSDKEAEPHRGLEREAEPDAGVTLPPENLSASRYPRRSRQPPQWFVASSAQVETEVSITTSDEPTLREAINSSPEERGLWESALDEEFESLDAKGTWQVDNNPGAQPLPTHAILKVKRKSDGSVERFKARVVAGGNFQIYGENYKETYAPVVPFSLVRMFLYLVLCLNMVVAQLDVKTAFLNGDLSENVWVMSPRGIPGRESRCYKLLKAIYGLKQAHLAWHTKLCDDLNGIGFQELPSAPCVFFRIGKSSRKTFILIYVDDLLILATTIVERDEIISEIQALYEVRVAKQVDLFLGVQLRWKLDPNGRLVGLSMGQSLYVESVLRRFGLEGSKPAVTPMIASFFTGMSEETDKTVVEVERYQQIIGSLLYLALRTRLDILAPVLILARFAQSPTAYCHRGAKRVLRYLRGTADFMLRYSAGSTELQAFVDADYAADITDRKSMSGFMVKLGEAVCIWGSKKQTATALSTCESEYYALTLAAKEVIWVRRVLKEAGIGIKGPTCIKSDNQSAINWATAERCPSGRAKHIDVRVHYIRELVRESTLSVTYVPSDQNDSDVLTKPLGPQLLENILKRVGLGGAIEEEC